LEAYKQQKHRAQKKAAKRSKKTPLLLPLAMAISLMAAFDVDYHK